MLHQSRRLRVECSDGIATLWLDSPGGNVLTLALLDELGRAIGSLEACRAIDVLLIRSSNRDTFLVGPDLDEYESLTDSESRLAFSRVGQGVLQRLKELSDRMATVALIDGECRDGGLELALACDFRLAVARPETRLGFDALTGGMLPCWGATQRLPRLIGPRAALDLLISGRGLPAREAKQLGLVDHAFGPRPAKTELWWFLAELQDHARQPARRSWWSRLKDSPMLVDQTVIRPMLSRIPIGHPTRGLVEAVRRGWLMSDAEGYAAERSAFARFGLSAIGGLRRKRARQRLELSREWHDVPLPKRIGFPNLDQHGVDLAVAALIHGSSVVVPDAAAMRPIGARLLRAVDRGSLTVVEGDQRLRNLAVDERFDECELVMITGTDVEQMALLFDLDRTLGSPVGLAITSSTVDCSRVARRLATPERVLAALMSRTGAEVVPTQWTDDHLIASVFRWLEQCGVRTTVSSAAGEVRTASVAA